jgi:hypothetical protein
MIRLPSRRALALHAPTILALALLALPAFAQQKSTPAAAPPASTQPAQPALPAWEQLSNADRETLIARCATAGIPPTPTSASTCSPTRASGAR